MSNIKGRGMIKWQPFDSLMDSSKIKHDISCQKQKKKLPTLSEDQIIEIEEKIKSAYYNRIQIYLTYFNEGYIYTRLCLIHYIDTFRKQIILNDNSIIHIEQILKIEFF